MEIVVDVLPELVVLVIAVGVAVARTTENSIDNKLAKLAQENKSGIISAIRSVIGTDPKTKKKVQDAVRGK